MGNPITDANTHNTTVTLSDEVKHKILTEYVGRLKGLLDKYNINSIAGPSTFLCNEIKYRVWWLGFQSITGDAYVILGYFSGVLLKELDRMDAIRYQQIVQQPQPVAAEAKEPATKKKLEELGQDSLLKLFKYLEGLGSSNMAFLDYLDVLRETLEIPCRHDTGEDLCSYRKRIYGLVRDLVVSKAQPKRTLEDPSPQEISAYTGKPQVFYTKIPIATAEVAEKQEPVIPNDEEKLRTLEKILHKAPAGICFMAELDGFMEDTRAQIGHWVDFSKVTFTKEMSSTYQNFHAYLVRVLEELRKKNAAVASTQSQMSILVERKKIIEELLAAAPDTTSSEKMLAWMDLVRSRVGDFIPVNPRYFMNKTYRPVSEFTNLQERLRTNLAELSSSVKSKPIPTTDKEKLEILCRLEIPPISCFDATFIHASARIISDIGHWLDLPFCSEFSNYNDYYQAFTKKIEEEIARLRESEAYRDKFPVA